jgi:integrase
VTNNAAGDVYPPKVYKDELTPLTREEARRLLDTVRRDRLEALYVVAVQSGLRQGELLALRWEDVDLEACTVQVRRTIARDGGKLAVAPTKTAKVGVKLTRDATEALRDHLERQLVEIDQANDKWQENGLVFCTSKGTLINPTNLRRGGPLPRSYNVPGLHR